MKIENKYTDKGVTVEGETKKVPSNLKNAVHNSLQKILHLLDGQSVKWHYEDKDRIVFEILGSFPEYPVNLNQTAPPYRTREEFTGQSGSDGGLEYELPDNWRYEMKNNSTFIFYKN